MLPFLVEPQARPSALPRPRRLAPPDPLQGLPARRSQKLARVWAAGSG